MKIRNDSGRTIVSVAKQTLLALVAIGMLKAGCGAPGEEDQEATDVATSQDPLYLRQDRPYNLLRWDLEVDPGSNGEKAQAVRYEFKLELDRQLNIGTFQSKSAR